MYTHWITSLNLSFSFQVYWAFLCGETHLTQFRKPPRPLKPQRSWRRFFWEDAKPTAVAFH